MRLFIALPVPAAAKKALRGTQAALIKKGVRGRCIPPENLHITLCFLGSVKDPAPVIEALRRVKVPRAALRPDRLTLFGDALALLFLPDPALESYVRALRQALDDAGVGYDRQAFKAHVTLLRKTSLPRPGFDLQKAAQPGNHTLNVNAVCLMASELRPEGAKYTVVYRKPAARENGGKE